MEPLLSQVHASGKKRAIMTEPTGEPVCVLNADAFSRDIWVDKAAPDPLAYCHGPIVLRKVSTRLGQVLGEFQLATRRTRQHMFDHDLLLVWGQDKRVITGADIVSYLPRGVTRSGVT